MSRGEMIFVEKKKERGAVMLDSTPLVISL